MADISLKVAVISFIGGLLPSLLWLWFWLKEDDEKPEPRGLLVLTFVIGMIGVFVVLPIENLLESVIKNQKTLTILWAATEEIVKYVAILFIALKSKDADEPIDFVIYMMTGALGFAALENALFLIDPVTLGNATVSLLTSNFRFLGAMLLHTIASGMIGVAMGLSFYKNKITKKIYLVIGLLSAIALHSIFNFLIIDSGKGLFGVFSVLWGVTIIILLLFEQLRRM